MSDWIIAYVARELQKRADTLERLPKRRGEVGIAEIKRRACLLLRHCGEWNEPPPQELTGLIEGLLGFADKDIATTATAKTSKQWWLAVEYESRQNILGAAAFTSASMTEVSRHAFGAGGDHRKTIREWRKDPDYRTAIFNLKATREVSGHDVIDEMRRYGPAGTNPLILLFDLPE